MSVNGDDVVSHNVVNLSLSTVPVFNGHGPVKDFIDSVNGTAALGNWTEVQKLEIAKLKLAGIAKQFLDSEPKLTDKDATWELFTTEILKRFKSIETPGKALYEFSRCQQRYGETIREYVVRLKIAANRTVTYGANIAENEFIHKRLKQDILNQFINGLLMPLKQRVMSKNPQTFDSAIDVAEREEMIEQMTKRATDQRVRGIVANNNNSPRNGRHYAQPTTQNPQQRQIKCFRCGRNGHMQRNCRVTTPPTGAYNERRNTCFKCGQMGHQQRDCRQQMNHSSWQGNRCTTCGRYGHSTQYCTSQGKPQSGTRQLTCYTCGNPGHDSRSCRRTNVVCGTCNKRGHLDKDCRIALNGSAATSTPETSVANNQAF